VNKTVLKNGVRILTKRMPHVHSVSMGVWVNVGARDESVKENGLSHLIEHMIFKGTGKRTAFQIAKEFDAIGGHTNAFTSMENTCYHAKVMDTHLETMVDILSDIFLNSIFDNQKLKRERPVILQEIGMVEDNPEDYIHQLSDQTFWGEHPLGRPIIGSRENVLGFDSDAIKNFFSSLYQPERIIISVAGNIDHDYFVRLIENLFTVIPTGKAFPEREKPESRSLVSINRREQEQTHISIGTKGIAVASKERYACSLMNTILGGNMSSRLFQEIREERGLAYSVYSYISSYSDTGMFGVYTGVDPDNTKETVEIILKSMHRLKDEKVSDTLLHNAKEYTKGNLMLASESIDDQMVRLAQNEIHFGKYIPIEKIVDSIEAVTPDEIQAIAEKLFRNDQVSLTALGPNDHDVAFEEMINRLI